MKIDADENADTLRAACAKDDGGTRLGELALVDGGGRIGPLETVFFDTLLDENAASHIALGSGYALAVDDAADKERVNKSQIHIDFMIGSPELDVDGITAAGEHVPVLRNGAWQLQTRDRGAIRARCGLRIRSSIVARLSPTREGPSGDRRVPARGILAQASACKHRASSSPAICFPSHRGPLLRRAGLRHFEQPVADRLLVVADVVEPRQRG